MSAFSKVIPGKVINEGIVSRENLAPYTPIISSPAHFPDFACVTPMGPVKRDTVSTAGFTEKFGNILDPDVPFYNPVAVAIQTLGKAAQASFSFRRLTGNEEKARVIMGVVLFADQDVPNYKRENGEYVYDDTGNPVPDATTPTVKGVFAFPVKMEASAATPIGKAKSIEITAPTGGTMPVGTKGKFYPLFELVSGIGDDYNSMYAAFGHPNSTDWKEISRFVRTYGAYPYTINIGRRLNNGLRVPATTVNGTPNVPFTLFDMTDDLNVRYGVQVAMDHFTGRDVNRPVEERPAPFSEAFVYRNNLDQVCEALYKAEYVDGVGQAPEIVSNKLPARAIMNPFSFVDHNGSPYRHVLFGGNEQFAADPALEVSRVSMNHYFGATGGVDPFADADGKYPEAPATWDVPSDGVWVATAGTSALVSHKQYWEMNQILLEAYLTSYRGSLDTKDVIRNRTSFMWDVGFNSAIKDLMISFMARRKDIIVVPCATEYLVKKTQEQIYSMRESLHAKISMIPESDTYQSHACRSAINLWDGKVLDEPTFGTYSLNIDNMYAFAIAGGGNDGKVYSLLMPDNKGNRTLRVMHTPFVQFEDDDPAANNLIQGSITVTPLNTTQFCRPALPTVYNNTDSVLKDLANVWICICVEKILQDQWIRISGNTQLSREGYIAEMKDESEARIRETLGSVISNYSVDPEFREDRPNAKSVMYTTTRLWFRKGVYMMNSVLEAYNEDSLTTQ